MLYAAICDDDRYMSGSLKKSVSNFFLDHGIDVIVMQFADGEELLRSDKHIDILFLDIRMKNTDGIETARKLRLSGFKGFLIFITVLKEQVFQAFEVQAFDYLLKPLQEERFNKTMCRLLENINNSNGSDLLIRIGYESRLIPVDDIVFCEVIDRKIYLHLLSSEVVCYYEKIEALENKLSKCFYRCHRSFLINLKYVVSRKSGSVLMKGGKEIPVSRLRDKEFSNVILRYMRDGSI